jgi:hypothetical protein
MVCAYELSVRLAGSFRDIEKRLRLGRYGCSVLRAQQLAIPDATLHQVGAALTPFRGRAMVLSCVYPQGPSIWPGLGCQ